MESKLSTYCKEWNLTVNTEKTKVMHVAHKDIGLEIPPPLLYNGVTLEWVAGFNYLGVYIDTKGRLQPKKAPIALKAHRAQFKLSNMVRTLPFDTKMWLHQTMVDPILLHGAEVWACQDRGILIRRHGIYHTFSDRGYKPLTGENIKRQYIRLQMGAPRHTPFLSLRGDSGVYPLYIEGLARAIEYYYLVSQSHPESLLGMTLKTQRQLTASGVSCWMNTIQSIRDALNLTEENEIPSKTTIVERLRLDYDTQWYTDLWTPKASGRLSTRLKWYHQFKTVMKKESYLNGTKTGMQVAIACLRLGGHGLPVETKRWEGIPYKNRACELCGTGAVGDELHLFQCAALQTMRDSARVLTLSHRKFIKVMRNPPFEYRRYI